MNTKLTAAILALFVLTLIGQNTTETLATRAATTAITSADAHGPRQPPAPDGPLASSNLIVGHAVYGEISPALRDLPLNRAAVSTQVWPARRIRAAPASGILQPQAAASADPLAMKGPAVSAMPAPLLTFDGISNPYGYVPSDSNGAVGPHHYVEMVNMQLAVYSKTNGSLLYGPLAINSLWSSVGGPCAQTNDGDPIVLYDQLADRWLVSQFSVSNATGPYYECVAISTSPDPAGSYYAYTFQMPAVPNYPNGKFPDYPKLAVWPDGYYMTMNQFSSGTYTGTYAGAAVWALDRAQMLTGVLTPTYVYIDLGAVSLRFGNILPANMDGARLPPVNSPAYFAEVDPASGSWPFSAMRLWYFNVNWTTPASSTFGLSGQPNAVIPVASFNYLPCVTSGSPNCIPQPGGAPALDAVGDRIMHRLVYRNFGNHESLLANHTVDAGGGLAGVRWYEVRDPGGSPGIYQQGTYAPDTTNRWMGSIAMDQSGNIAIGYSASSASITPSIRYSGRLATDPLGALSQGEQSIINGAGVQTNSTYSRWGDYSAMTIDPSDDCTFWYVNQYYSFTSSSYWHTRVGAFRFPTCGMGALTGVITDVSTTAPISGALVIATAPTGAPLSAYSDANGLYAWQLPSNTYTVTASLYGYQPAAISGVSVTLSSTTTQNIGLVAAATYIVSGTVSDIVSGQPLTASVQVSGSPFDPPVTTTTTDAGGTYSLTLSGSQSYTLTASADFHPSQTRYLGVLSSNLNEDFALWRQVLLTVVMRQ
ncbi:MAG: carboxypeptidase regulatory-like domain-containing protein [Chloroflexi bacterium]|nr:carboxypeptidase regulatory-like domain-containing protein [Chloroflexota bacterium]MCL5275775.1 carboxypeptidase regulatory-like domain-containing protein [Chloroflexota bacterium]